MSIGEIEGPQSVRKPSAIAEQPWSVATQTDAQDRRDSARRPPEQSRILQSHGPSDDAGHSRARSRSATTPVLGLQQAAQPRSCE